MVEYPQMDDGEDLISACPGTPTVSDFHIGSKATSTGCFFE